MVVGVLCCFFRHWTSDGLKMKWKKKKELSKWTSCLENEMELLTGHQGSCIWSGYSILSTHKVCTSVLWCFWSMATSNTSNHHFSALPLSHETAAESYLTFLIPPGSSVIPAEIPILAMCILPYYVHLAFLWVSDQCKKLLQCLCADSGEIRCLI